jgi:acyl transferase domain-containing protein
MSVEPIAIIGVGCRFPGADDPEAYWALLRAGRDAVREVPPGRWDAAALVDPDARAPGRLVNVRGGFLDRVDAVDWRALRISPREASTIDPQHRLLLEVAWETLEDAGLPLHAVAGARAGVFVGVTWNDFQRLHARDWSRLDGYVASGTPLAFAANRLSYAFDLRGPSVALDATCSSSLVAVHQACMSLWADECALALAGGVNLMLSPDSAIVMAKAGVLSPTGACRALDAAGDGFVRGEGAGLVALVRRSSLGPGDRVYAWIRGTAVNHVGRGPWIMAPSPAAQAGAIDQACRRGGVAPSDLEYVELHGSGFAQGDRVEAEALGAALGGAGRGRPCRIGSVKTNIGNLEAAAGIASLIKVALALARGELPPTLNLAVPNPEIGFSALGLAPQTELSEWTGDGRVAGVTTVSFSGVNAHAVLAAAERPASSPAVERTILPLSARTPEALRDMARRTAEWLRRADASRSVALADVSYTAALRRSHHAHRLAVNGGSLIELAEGLERWLAGSPEGALEGFAARWVAGAEVDWSAVTPLGRCVSLPTYAWQRERAWPEWLDVATVSRSPGCGEPAVRATEASLRADLLAATPDERRERLEGHVREVIRDALGLPADTPLPPERRLFELGFTSITAVAVRGRFQATLGCALPPTLLFEHPTVAALCAALLRALVPAPPAPARAADPAARRIAALSEREAEALLAATLSRLEGDF